MVFRKLRKFKPGVSIRTHRIVAASIWSLVGILLMSRGVSFLLEAGMVWLALVSVVIGTLKSLSILDKSAAKNIARIAGLQEGTCLGSVYSFKMWGLIICMIVAGRLLRLSGLPAEFIGVLFGAVGWALFFSSRLLWKNI